MSGIGSFSTKGSWHGGAAMPIGMIGAVAIFQGKDPPASECQKTHQPGDNIEYLHEALVALMQEKRYDNIIVQGTIDRMNVGPPRSSGLNYLFEFPIFLTEGQ